MARKSIIIEGADGSGKSTLAETLGKHYGMYVFKAGPKPVDSEHAEVCMIYQCAWISKYPCIWDRFTGISNICNLPPVDPVDVPMHAHYVNQAMKDAVIIICTTENLDNHRLENYESEEDERRIRYEYATVSDNYRRMAHDLHNVIRYDFKVRSLESLIEEIDHALSVDVSGPEDSRKTH